MKRRVVITGMGGLSPIGNTVPEMWENAKKRSLRYRHDQKF